MRDEFRQADAGQSGDVVDQVALDDRDETGEENRALAMAFAPFVEFAPIRSLDHPVNERTAQPAAQREREHGARYGADPGDHGVPHGTESHAVGDRDEFGRERNKGVSDHQENGGDHAPHAPRTGSNP